MGRNPTGSLNLTEAYPIRIADLIREGALKRGRIVKSSIKLLDGLQLTLIGSLLQGENYLEISYKPLNSRKRIRYRVGILERASNLGNGYIYSFLCPITGRATRTLYKNPNSLLWSSYYSFRGSSRIYYPAQRYSKLERLTEGYYRLQDRLQGEMDPKKAQELRRRITGYNLQRLEYLLRGLQF